MRYLSLALFAEGPTDHEFLHSILYRATHELASALSDSPVEIPEQFVRGVQGSMKGARPDRLERAFGAALASGAVSILFVHADEDGDLSSARTDRYEPCEKRGAKLIQSYEIGMCASYSGSDYRGVGAGGCVGPVSRFGHEENFGGTGSGFARHCNRSIARSKGSAKSSEASSIGSPKEENSAEGYPHPNKFRNANRSRAIETSSRVSSVRE